MGARIAIAWLACSLAGCVLDRSGTRRDAGDGVPIDAAADAGRDAAIPVPDDGGLDAGSDAGTDAGVLSVLAVAAGGDASCALRSDGAVLCWGHDDEGQLGDGVAGGMRTVPERVELPGPAVSVTLGDEHGCAIVSGGELYCWGANASGQVGSGSEEDVVASPERVSASTASVVAGGSHTCLLDFSGTLFCWGANTQGQLGFAGAARRVPERVEVVGAIAQIALGQAFTCARLGDGTAQCWGLNTDRQLGDTTAISRDEPTPVSMLAGVLSIGLGWKHACAVHEASAACWGRGNDGRLGDGGSTTRGVPSTVVDLTDAVAIEGGEDCTCARRTGGLVSCWGRDDHDQIANDRTSSSVAVEMTFVPGSADDLDLGRGHACVVVAGAAWCWGDGDQGQLGDVTTGSAAPLRVEGLLP